MNENPEVRFRCAGKNCSEEGRTRIGDLVGDGCPACGSKRLEVWHPHQGHVLIDYRAQKSVRKNRRRRERAVAAIVGIALGLLVGCTPAPDDLDGENLISGEQALRPAPAVSWWFSAYDSLCGTAVIPASAYGADYVYPNIRIFVDGGFEIREPETFRLYLGAVQEESFVQLWRVEWSPTATGDTCFYPIAFPILHHETPAGLIVIQISGAIAATDSTPGDRIMFWRSEPYPDELVEVFDSTFCMDAVYGD